MPKTTTYRTVNLTFQWGFDGELIRAAAEGRGGDRPADVLELVEARTADNEPVDVAAELGPDWAVYQDLSNGATAGTAVASRISSVRVPWAVRKLLSLAGRDVQARFFRAAAVRRAKKHAGRIAVVHTPLEKTGRQDDAVRTIRRWADRQRRALRRWKVSGDFNMTPEEMARALKAPHFYGKKPMGVVWSRGWGKTQTSARMYEHADHVVLTFTTTK